MHTPLDCGTIDDGKEWNDDLLLMVDKWVRDILRASACLVWSGR